MATQMTLTVPEGIPQLLKMSDDDFTHEAQFLLAVKLFELGKLTSGKAAELAGIPRVAFLHLLDRYYVPAINLQAEEIEHELTASKRLAK